MADSEGLVRVVAVRRQGFRGSEFALRPSDEGLSVFGCGSVEDAKRIVAAVKAAGKAGSLGAAEIMDGHRIVGAYARSNTGRYAGCCGEFLALRGAAKCRRGRSSQTSWPV